MYLSDRALSWQVQGPTSNPEKCKKRKKTMNKIHKWNIYTFIAQREEYRCLTTQKDSQAYEITYISQGPFHID
jgi:hypothetical protein